MHRLFLVALFSACGSPVPEAGRPCPCSTGWTCCDLVCVQGASCEGSLASGDAGSLWTLTAIAPAPNLAGPAVGSIDAPEGLAIDSAGNVYVADTFNDTIVLISTDTVTFFTGGGFGFAGGFADGALSQATFEAPAGIAIESGLNAILVADTGNNAIRVALNGEVGTLAGKGTGFQNGATSTAQFQRPQGIAVDASENIYVADTGNDAIRLISGDTVSTLAGTGAPGLQNGPAPQAQFNEPEGIAVDGAGNVYVADTANAVVRLIVNGTVSTLAGDGTPGLKDGPAATAQFNQPRSLAADGKGDIAVADVQNARVRLISNGQVTTILDFSQQTGAPMGVAFDGSGQLYVAQGNAIWVAKP